MPTRPRTSLGPAEFALLGLLLEEPDHGYELVAKLERLGLGELFPLEPPTLYGCLKRLEHRGFIHWQEERTGNRPSRKVYRLTDEGRAAVETWLGEPVERLRLIRQEFLLKLSLLDRLGRYGERRNLVRRQISRCRDYLSSIDAGPASTPIGELNRGARTSAAIATIDWLQALDEDEGVAGR